MRRLYVAGLWLLAAGTSNSRSFWPGARQTGVVTNTAVGDCIEQCSPSSPREYGACYLGCVQSEVGSDAAVELLTVDDPHGQAVLDAAGATLDSRAESFAVVRSEATTTVVGRDAAGAMYGAMELADRLRLNGPGFLPLAATLAGAPAVAVRAANLFLVLREQTETRWWFLEERFWREYLDLLATSRINFLDLHAMYNLGNTIFPNALLYFATSETFPDVGVPAAEREENLAMLNMVIQMAAVRGIQVGLMTYRSDARPTGEGPPQLPDGSDELRLYTREATSDWRSTPAVWIDSSYQAVIDGGGHGGMFAVEILSSSGEGWRYPDLFQETPYRALAP